MTCIEELLRSSAPRLEEELKRRLQGFLGGMIRQYLPQTWVFRTEQESVSLRVDAGGAVSVAAGGSERPDLTIEVGHDRLRRALSGGPAGPATGGPLNVIPHSAKGKAAWSLIRGRIGLAG